jgi:hypothetical protein
VKREDRIANYERLFDETTKAVNDFEEALETFKAAQNNLKKLDKYLSGKQWMSDFEAAENGKIPKNLKCGVLSEDGIYNLLEKNSELIESVKEFAAKECDK